ncbi:MAG: YbhB/YbcL family Raf kinase inhibitor-like protein [Deltaproteobacteria bacterium]|nr:YbhB/YbcL family Raf kinase inhibitor-like protein [Deltaproteobacteria bacterium]
MAFTMKSEAFKEGDTIPREYSCDGSDLSPSLGWTDPPAGTGSFALTVEDPDAPVGTFTHWVIYDIPADMKGLASGISTAASLEKGMKQGINDFGRNGYGGPCPPRGHGRHRYYFTLRALDVKTLNLLPRSSKSDVEKAMKGRVIGTARLMGVYKR